MWCCLLATALQHCTGSQTPRLPAPLWPQGWNARGTLGHGHREPVGKPQRVAGLAGVRIRQAAIGGWHVLALDDTGQCWAWGGNE